MFFKEPKTVSTIDLFDIIKVWPINLIDKNTKVIPAPLNYKGYPKSICTSNNAVVCHGIPDDKPLKDGDILNIDVTVILTSMVPTRASAPDPGAA